MRLILILAALALSAVEGPAGAYDAAAGRRLYLQNCAKCHGAEGKGNGPAAVRLDPRPRDLTSGLYKVRTTPSGSLASFDDVVRTLNRGLPASSMPGFEGVLSPGEIADLAGYVLSLPGDAEFKTAAPESLGAPVFATPKGVARGAALYVKLRCGECHGDTGRGDGRSADKLTGEFGRPTRPADLSAPWSFKGGREAADVVMRLTAGIDLTPMPSFQDSTSLKDRWDLAHYVLSLRREPFTETRVRTKLERGRYLARSMACGMCHTTTRAEDGSSHESRELAGGVKIVAYPFGVFHSRNLTPDTKAGLGNWSETDIVTALKTGTRPDGTRIPFNGMPWAFFAALPDDDLSAIAAYLKSLPPSDNRVPPDRKFVYTENIGYKLAHLFFRQPATFEVYPGNAGMSPTWGQADYVPFTGAEVPGQRRRAAYYAFFGFLLLLLLVAGFFLQLSFRLTKRWQQAVALALAVGVLAVGAAGYALLYFLPPLDLLPPEKVVSVVLADAPQPKVDDPKLLAVAMRGRMLANANCAMCHTPVPMLTPPDPRLALTGGQKITNPLFGTRYVRNLTPDKETGLGDWGMADIIRAVKSGVTKDGRHLNWLDMPWDRFSNMDDEDLTAIALYLKSIPPVKHKVPAPEEGKPDDPKASSIYFEDSGKLLK